MDDSDSFTNPLLKDFSWHQKCWLNFAKAKKSHHLPHAILLTGEEGIAKNALATRMAKSLLCVNSFDKEFDACNVCQSCRTFESGANPDFIQINLLEDKQQISVDQVRGLSDFLNYSRSYNSYRVVIISPVERMNLNAANSLLKSLEEPTPNTILILVTSKVSQLLPTIKSRCQLFSVASPIKSTSIEWLVKNMVDNQYSLGDLEDLINVVGNKPLKILNLNQEDIDSRKNFFQDLSFVQQERMSVSEMSKKWEKYDLEVIVDWQISFIQHSIRSLMCANEESKEQMSLLKNFSIDSRWCLYHELVTQKQYVHTSVNSLMFIENMILLWK